MIKKISFGLATIIQILLIITAFALHILSKKKMGVMRHFVYTNNKLNNMYNMQSIINIALFIILVIIIFSILLFFRMAYSRRRFNIPQIYSSRYLYILNTSLFLLGILLMIFLKVFSANKLLSYYYMSLIFFIVYIIEFIKISVYFLIKKINIKNNTIANI